MHHLIVDPLLAARHAAGAAAPHLHAVRHLGVVGAVTGVGVDEKPIQVEEEGDRGVDYFSLQTDILTVWSIIVVPPDSLQPYLPS